MTIDVVKLIEILVGFFAATLTAVGVLVSYLSKSDKQSFKNLQQLYSTLEKRLETAELDLRLAQQDNKRLDGLVSEYKDSQEKMQRRMVALDDEKKDIEKKYQRREEEIKEILFAKDKELTKLKHDLFELERKVKLLEKVGTGQLPPRKA